MSWETPSFKELRMDAEIGSYQDDFDPDRDAPAFVAIEAGARVLVRDRGGDGRALPRA